MTTDERGDHMYEDGADERGAADASGCGSHEPGNSEHAAHVGEFAEELRLLAEVILERVEPVLRRTAAADGRTEWGGCSWCPVCAAAALARGEHHDVVAAIAGHGIAIVTVLREALAGVPVEPVLPTDPPPGTGEPHAPDLGDPPGRTTDRAAADADGRASPGHESRSAAGEYDSRAAGPSASGGDKPRYVSIPVQIKA